MPVPRNDVCYSTLINKTVRVADKNDMVPSASVPQRIFSKGVHPFSSSLSGTMLWQLRSWLYLKEQGMLNFKTLDDLANYAKCYASALLFNAGGHTFYEFFSIFLIKEIQDAFQFLKHNADEKSCYRNMKDFTLENLLYKDNQDAFDAALTATIQFNKTLLQRAKVRQQLLTTRKPVSSLETKETKEQPLVAQDQHYVFEICEELAVHGDVHSAERVFPEFFNRTKKTDPETLVKIADTLETSGKHREAGILREMVAKKVSFKQMAKIKDRTTPICILIDNEYALGCAAEKEEKFAQAICHFEHCYQNLTFQEKIAKTKQELTKTVEGHLLKLYELVKQNPYEDCSYVRSVLKPQDNNLRFFATKSPPLNRCRPYDITHLHKNALNNKV